VLLLLLLLLLLCAAAQLLHVPYVHITVQQPSVSHTAALLLGRTQRCMICS
jgi:hypothetical protein